MTQDQNGVVVVLGAAGAVGRSLAQALVDAGDLELRLVDIQDTEIASLERPGVEVMAADVFDPVETEKVLAGATLLVNCLSLVFFDRVFDLAVTHGIDYADLISEPTPEQEAAAKAAGITAVPGLGMSPGLTNVLVAHATSMMRVEEVDILFAVYRAMASSGGALDTMIWEGSEYSPDRNYYLDGEFIPAGPFDGARKVDFGGSFGEVEVYYRPHPEPKTLPKNIPSIRFAAVRGTWQPEINADLKVLNKYGLLAEDTMERTKEIIWDRIGGLEDPVYRGRSASKIEVRGVTRDGERVLRTYTVKRPEDKHSYTLTGLVASQGVRLMARRGRVKTGVVEPEVYFDPEDYIAAVAEQGVVGVSWIDQPWEADTELTKTPRF
jgi:saccharopine dehydrogenase-like NADP-dependent oxidoreductase